MSFFSRLRDTVNDALQRRRSREATKRFEKGRDRGQASTPSRTERIQIEIPEELEESEVTYQAETYVEDYVAVERAYVPGPDPMRLSSGDLLATAAFYGVTDQEYAEISDMVDAAYNDPASTPEERREALIGLQDAMSMVHDRATEDSDFDWDAWRAEVYGEKQ